jgi:hypothetical protein
LQRSAQKGAAGPPGRRRRQGRRRRRQGRRRCKGWHVTNTVRRHVQSAAGIPVSGRALYAGARLLRQSAMGVPPVQQHTTDLIVALLQYFIFLLIPKPTSPRATSVTAAVAAAVATAAAAAALAARDVSFSAQFLLLHPNPFNPHGAGALEFGCSDGTEFVRGQMRRRK